MTLRLIGITPAADVYFSDDDGVVRAHSRLRHGEPIVTNRAVAERTLLESGAEIIDLEVPSWSELEAAAESRVRRVMVDPSTLPIGPTMAAYAPRIIREWLEDPERAADVPRLVARLLAADVVIGNPTLIRELSALLDEAIAPAPPAAAVLRPSERMSEAWSYFAVDAA